jgi:hypothetical protein
MRYALLLSLLALVACGPTATGAEDDAGGADAGGDGPLCGGICPGGLICIPALGCVQCQPGTTYCSSNDRVMSCDELGTGHQVETCDIMAGQTCVLGSCLAACDAAAQNRSNVGCEYWPVDLPQYCDLTIPIGGICERTDPYAVLVANLNAFSVHVLIEQNGAAPGEPLALATVDERDIGAGGLAVITLPQREIDGSDNTNPETLSGITSRAYRLTSSGPVVAYQINTLYETDSIDASLLIPTSALDTRYRTISWPSAVLDVAGVHSRNRSFVTIVGTAAGTHVTVTAGGHVVAGPGVAETLKGGTIEADLGPFDVLHLAGTTSGMSAPAEEGDLSGTVVESTLPVVVFAGHVCANAGAPGGGGACCCDHLEEQVPPASALGKQFAVTRSAPRGTAGDVWRILADKPGTTVTTNLAAPLDAFALDENVVFEFYATTDFVLEASAPVLLAQILVGTEAGAGTGDPSLTFMPPIDQARKEYVFLVPETYSANYAVIGREAGTALRIDGLEAPGEFGSCTVSAIGTVGGKAYESVRCPLQTGVHTLDADAPVSLIEYGYGGTGSIAYVGGADVRRINLD